MTEEDLKSRLVRVETKLNEVSERVVSLEKNDAIADVHRSNVEVRLSAIENNTTWLLRLIIGALVMALLAYIIQGGIAGA